jgi:undecaprenyl-diphosphatase
LGVSGCIRDALSNEQPITADREEPSVKPDPIAILKRAVRVAGQELPLVLAILLIAGGLWAFVWVSEEVIEGDTRAADKTVLLALRSPADRGDPIGPGWVEELGRDATALGGVGVLTYITLAVAGFLALQGKGRAAIFVIIAIACGITLSFALKAGFDRPRPDLVSHGSIVYTASFPSGHSMMSAVVYLTLGALLARFQTRRRLKAYVIVLAVLITLIVGASRVYLGVHWPTDVLAGWAAGASWAMLCWAVALWLQRHRHVEQTPDEMSTAGDGAR